MLCGAEGSPLSPPLRCAEKFPNQSDFNRRPQLFIKQGKPAGLKCSQPDSPSVNFLSGSSVGPSPWLCLVDLPLTHRSPGDPGGPDPRSSWAPLLWVLGLQQRGWWGWHGVGYLPLGQCGPLLGRAAPRCLSSSPILCQVTSGPQGFGQYYWIVGLWSSYPSGTEDSGHILSLRISGPLTDLLPPQSPLQKSLPLSAVFLLLNPSLSLWVESPPLPFFVTTEHSAPFSPTTRVCGLTPGLWRCGDPDSHLLEARPRPTVGGRNIFHSYCIIPPLPVIHPPQILNGGGDFFLLQQWKSKSSTWKKKTKKQKTKALTN